MAKLLRLYIIIELLIHGHEKDKTRERDREMENRKEICRFGLCKSKKHKASLDLPMMKAERLLRIKRKI